MLATLGSSNSIAGDEFLKLVYNIVYNRHFNIIKCDVICYPVKK